MTNSPRGQKKNKVNIWLILVNWKKNYNPGSSDWMIFGNVFLFLGNFWSFIIRGHVDVVRLTSFHHKENL